VKHELESHVVLFLAGMLLASCSHGTEEPANGSRSPGASVPWFREEALARGLAFTHRSGHAKNFYFPELMGGGAALFDMDGDGDLDAFLVQSGSLADPPPPGERHRLFANQGGGRFLDVTEGSGVDVPGYGMGVATGDYDGDGDLDLYVTDVGPNVLLANDGAGRFHDATAQAGVGDAGWGTSACFFDYDADGDLDLFVTNYVRWSRESERTCFDPTGKPDYCSPTEYEAPAQDTLYQNQGDGTFHDVTEAAGLRLAFGNGLGVVAADFDADGRLDLFVANDQTPNQLWLNQGDGTFRDAAALRNCAVDPSGRARAGMGVDAADLDDDQDVDLLVVNMARENDGLFVNQGKYFVEETTRSGIGGANKNRTRFGAGFADFDLDGRLDLFVANGRVNMVMPPLDPADPYAEPNSLWRGTAPLRFEEIQPTGGTDPVLSATSRGAAFGDVDGDGGIDVLVVNRDGPAHLLMNVAPARGHWLRARVLEKNGSNALGASVTFRLGERHVRREVKSGYSYCSASDPAVHLGLGATTHLETLSVRWIDGTVEVFGPFDADRTVSLKRGEGRAH
jgi:hypothetical protein